MTPIYRPLRRKSTQKVPGTFSSLDATMPVVDMIRVRHIGTDKPQLDFLWHYFVAVQTVRLHDGPFVSASRKTPLDGYSSPFKWN